MYSQTSSCVNQLCLFYINYSLNILTRFSNNFLDFNFSIQRFSRLRITITYYPSISDTSDFIMDKAYISPALPRKSTEVKESNSLLILNLKSHNLFYRLFCSCLLLENTIRLTNPPSFYCQTLCLYTVSLNNI